MRTFSLTLCAFLVSLGLAAPATAQQATRASTKPAPVMAPSPVAIAETFGIATANERWSLDDPPPGESVIFGGRVMTMEERGVTVAAQPGGERQIVFPVSWFPAYETSNPDIKFVVVRYDATGARTIIVEYQADRVSMPKSEFKFDESGKRFYRDLAFTRQAGKMYVKQALSAGQDDGKGNFWIDSVLIYSVDEPPAPATPSAKKPGGKP